MSDLMVRDDASLSISFVPAAVALKESALERSALIALVGNEAQQQVAVDAQRDLTLLLKIAEEARKEAKAPILDFGKKIDAAHKAFVGEVQDEQSRISTLIGDFQTNEQARVRALQNLQVQGLTALEKERETALAAATTDEGRDAILEDFNTRIREQSSEAIAPARVAGQQVRQEWEVIVTDIHRLYRFHPNCVKLEPLNGEIKQLLDAGVSVHGVTAKKVTKASVRIGRQPAAIEA